MIMRVPLKARSEFAKFSPPLSPPAGADGAGAAGGGVASLAASGGVAGPAGSLGSKKPAGLGMVATSTMFLAALPASRKPALSPTRVGRRGP